MKKQLFVLVALTLTSLTLTSCGKDPEAIKAAISEAQFSYLVEDALQEAMGGLSEQITIMVEIAKDTISSQCGVTKDSTIVTEGQTVVGSYAYTTEYTWTLECEQDLIPTNFEFICQSQGSYNNNRLNSNDSSYSNWVLEGLSESDNLFKTNGTYSRDGEQTFKTEGIVTESNIDFVVTNLTINKASEEIISGSAEVTAHGSTDTGESFYFEGQIVFLGNGKVKLTVNGKTFFLTL